LTCKQKILLHILPVSDEFRCVRTDSEALCPALYHKLQNTPCDRILLFCFIYWN